MKDKNRREGFLHDLESAVPENRREYKWNKVKKLLGLASADSDEFKSRMKKHGLSPEDIRTINDFSNIPVLHKKDIICFQEENGLDWMLATPMGRLRRIYQSPGPIFDPEGDSYDYWGWAEAFYACGFRAEDVVQITFGYHMTPAGLMMEEPLRNIGCCCIPAGPGNTQAQIELMSRLPVTGFVGMASYLKIIGEKAAKQGIDPRKDLNLQVAFVAAERLTDSLRREVEELFDIQVRQGYGTADAGCIGYECPQLGGMHISSRCWVEICDPETGYPLPEGETGEVVVTPFNDSYPLIRLGTGDLSAFVNTACSCGRTALKLKGILGRVDDTAKVKGQFIYPHQAARVISAFPEIQKWQMVISNDRGSDTILLKVRSRSALNDAKLISAFQKTMKLRPALQILSDEKELPEDAPDLLDIRTFD